MRTAERGQEVIKGVFVGDVYGLQAQAPSVSVTVEDIVFANGSVEKTARLDARWILVIVLCARSRNFHQV